MKIIEAFLLALWNVTLFVVATIFFIPALLIVNNLQDFWSKKLNELFGF